MLNSLYDLHKKRVEWPHLQAIPMALATLSTIAAAINSVCLPDIENLLDHGTVATPCHFGLHPGPALPGVKNNTCIIYRQPVNDITSGCSPAR